MANKKKIGPRKDALINFNVEPAQRDRLILAARGRGWSVSQLLREIVRDWESRNRRPAETSPTRPA